MSKYYDGTNFETLANRNNIKWRVIIGERSNGKTYHVKKIILDNAIKAILNNEPCNLFMILRRWREDILNYKCARMFDDLKEYLEKTYNAHILYKNREFVIYFSDDEIHQDTKKYTIGYIDCLVQMENNKSIPFPNVKTIFFDEFISSKRYIRDETTLLINWVSTIVRDRTDTNIYLCGNTISKICPYFDLWGINAHNLKPNDLKIYENRNTKIILEYTNNKILEAETTQYFNFGDEKNKKNNVISGEWCEDYFYNYNCDDVYLNEIIYNKPIYFYIYLNEIYYKVCYSQKYNFVGIAPTVNLKNKVVISNEYITEIKKKYNYINLNDLSILNNYNIYKIILNLIITKRFLAPNNTISNDILCFILNFAK